MTLRSIRSLFIALLLASLFATLAADATTSSAPSPKWATASSGCRKPAASTACTWWARRTPPMSRRTGVRMPATRWTSASSRRRTSWWPRTVTLVKLGPNSIDPKKMVSPMHVVVRETGKTGIIATPKGFNRTVKFSNARKKTKYDPVGWVPAPGEEIEVEFTTVPSRFAFDITYQLGTVKRIAK